jgi:hypothetical protein
MSAGLELHLSVLNRFATGINAPCALEVIDSSLALLSLRDSYLGPSGRSRILGKDLQELRHHVSAYNQPVFLEHGPRERLLVSLVDSGILTRPIKEADDYRDDLMKTRFENDVSILSSTDDPDTALTAAGGLLMIHRERLPHFANLGSIISAKKFIHDPIYDPGTSTKACQRNFFEALFDLLERAWLWSSSRSSVEALWKTLGKIRRLGSSLALLHWCHSERIRKPERYLYPHFQHGLIDAYEDLMKASYAFLSDREWKRTAAMLEECRSDLEQYPLSPESLNGERLLSSWFQRFDLTPREREDFEGYWMRMEELFLRRDIDLIE